MNIFNSRATRLIQFISLFMIALIVSMPITFALTISSVSVKGADNIPNIVRETDKPAVTVTLTKGEGETVTADNIRSRLFAVSKDQYQFTECSMSGINGFICVYRPTTNITLDPDAFLFYDVKLLRQGSSSDIEAEARSTYYVDSQAPDVDLLAVRRIGQKLFISANVSDMQFFDEDSDFSVCSGIKSFTMLIKEIPIFSGNASTSCLAQMEKEIELSVLTPEQRADGIIVVRAEDGTGHVGEARSSRIIMDISAPQFTNISLFTLQTSRIQFVESAGASVFVSFKTNVSRMNVTTLTVSLDGNPLTVGTCNFDVCTTSNSLAVRPGSHTIIVSGVDNYQNTGSSTATIVLESDSTAATLQSLRSTVVSGGVSYIAPSTTIIARLSETQSGLSAQKIFLSHDSARYPANECKVISAGVWECYWSAASFTLADGNVTLTVSGTDAVGNDISGILSASFVYDTHAPTVFAVSKYAVSSVGEQLNGPFISHSQAKLNFSYTDASPVTVTADFSALDGAARVTNNCANGQCVVVSNALSVGPRINKQIPLIVSDVLNNTVAVSVGPIDLLYTDTNSSADYFSHVVRLSPPSFEVSTAKYINQRAFALVDLRANGDVGVLSSRFLGCTGAQTGAKNDIILFLPVNQSQTGNASQVILSLQLKAVDLEKAINDSRIEVVCDIAVTGIAGSTFVPQEVEKVLLNFSVYKLTAGEIGDSYQAEVDRAIEDATGGLANKIASFEEYFEIARKICRIFNALTGLLHLLQGVTTLIKTPGEAMQSNPYTYSFGVKLSQVGSNVCSTEQQGSTYTNKLMKLFEGVCQFVNCEWSLTGAMISKFGGGEFFKGGQNDVQSRVTNAAGATWGKNVAAYGGLQYTDKNNLFWSVINLCIPGIIHNLREAQQIKCRYAKCLRDDVPSGIPKQACDDALAYNECEFLWGNVFGALPVVALYQYWVNMFKSLISDPMAIAGAVIGAYCTGVCNGTFPGSSLAYTGCRLASLLKEVGAMIKNIMGIIDMFDENKQNNIDYCEGL